MEKAYFFDTYAILEIINGNPEYEKFKEVKAIFTIFNIMELHYSLLKKFSIDIANDYTDKYFNFVVDVNLITLKKASYFKFKHKKKEFSAADVVGYITANRLGIKFLTGDNDFKGMPNVEFVK